LKENHDTLQAELKDMYQEFMEIKDAKGMLEAQISNMISQEKDNGVRISQLVHELTKIRNHEEKVMKERDIYQVELKSVRNMLAQKEDQIEDTVQEKAELLEKIQDCQHTLDKLKNDREDLLDDNKKLHEDNNKLLTSLTELNKFIENQKSKYETEREKDQEIIKCLKGDGVHDSSAKKYHISSHVDGSFGHQQPFAQTCEKTADFHYSNSKENISLNSIQNIPTNFENYDSLSYGKITKNRNKTRSVQRT